MFTGSDQWIKSSLSDRATTRNPSHVRVMSTYRPSRSSKKAKLWVSPAGLYSGHGIGSQKCSPSAEKLTAIWFFASCRTIIL